ncbi:hypothetical protein QF036_002475 [Arthrobacter globiformis]|nr:hypothetical protein [Arthrobacter globiformis]
MRSTLSPIIKTGEQYNVQNFTDLTTMRVALQNQFSP